MRRPVGLLRDNTPKRVQHKCVIISWRQPPRLRSRRRPWPRDGSGYIGIEGGLTFPKDPKIDASINYNDPTVTDISRTDVGKINLKTGYDVDLIGGYDFGMFRLEAELGYKHAKASNRFDFRVHRRDQRAVGQHADQRRSR